MFKQLMRKWKVGARQFWIIFIVFGCTGITTAFLTKQIAHFAGFNERTWWVWSLLLRLAMLLFGYQAVLLLFAALFGQWKFFGLLKKRYSPSSGCLKQMRLKKIMKKYRNKKQ